MDDMHGPASGNGNSSRSTCTVCSRQSRNSPAGGALMMTLEFTLNGKACALKVRPSLTLQDILRDVLGLTGTKKGCEQGVCGSCTVLLNGKAVNACLVLAPLIHGQPSPRLKGSPRVKTCTRCRRPSSSTAPYSVVLHAGHDPLCKALLDETTAPGRGAHPQEPAGQPVQMHGVCQDYRSCSSCCKRQLPGQRVGECTVDVFTKQDPFEIIGRSVPRIDGIEKATGSAIYVNDLKMNGMLHAGCSGALSPMRG